MLSFSPILRSKANPQYINPSMELGIVPVIEKDTTDFEHLIKKLIPIIAAISNFTRCHLSVPVSDHCWLKFLHKTAKGTIGR